jgi:hypothetical protein
MRLQYTGCPISPEYWRPRLFGTIWKTLKRQTLLHIKCL